MEKINSASSFVGNFSGKNYGLFFFNFDSTKILNRSVGDILNFVLIFFLVGIYINVF